VRKAFSLLILIISLLVTSCGHRKDVTGGKEDTENPTVVSVIPEPYSNITDQNIEITFSKPIDRSSVYSGEGGIYIYPLVSAKKFRWKDNVLTIEINEELAPNHNYHLTISQQIRDLRRNNLNKDYHYVFHTGELKYSTISGKIEYEDEKDIGLPVSLSIFSADSVKVFQQTAKNREYRIDNLSGVGYILRAFIDKNENKRYDSGKEPFYEVQFNASEQRKVDIELTYFDDKKPELQTVNVEHSELIRANFNKPIKSTKGMNLHSADSLAAEVKILAYDIIESKIEIVIPALDTLEYKLTLFEVEDLKGNVAQEMQSEFTGKVENDTKTPQIVATLPRNGAVVYSVQPTIELTFNKFMSKENLVIEVIDLITKKSVPITVDLQSSRVVRVSPKIELLDRQSYQLKVKEDTTDIFGIAIEEEFSLQFLPIGRD